MSKKGLFPSSVFVGQKQFAYQDLRNMAKADPKAFVHRVQNMVEKGLISLQTVRDIRGWWWALADVQVPITMQDPVGAHRDLMASAFPILVGSTVVKAINDAYMNYGTIGENLVEEIDDPKKVTTIAAIHTLDKDKDEVTDGEDFPEIGATEESVEIRHRQNGRILRIHANTISENDVADIVSRVNALGEIAADFVEDLTLKRVSDYDGSASSAAEPYAYRPNGSGTALYSATANTPGTRAPSGTRVTTNPFTDEANLEAARVRLRTMKNSRGKRLNVPWSEVALLVPDTIIHNVLAVLNSEYVPGVVNELSSFGPRGKFSVPPERVFSSPKLDDLSTAAWYLGAFRRQFRRKWKLRFEYVTLGTDTQAYLNSRTAFQARIAWDCEVGAVDYVYVIQNLSATTSPKDD